MPNAHPREHPNTVKHVVHVNTPGELGQGIKGPMENLTNIAMEQWIANLKTINDLNSVN
jgi:hypothetical protein